MKRTLILTLSTTLGATLLAAPAISEELAVVGSWSGLPLHRQFEAPFWNDVLSEVSQGSLSSALTTHDQMGIGGGDVFRMLGDGVFDVGMTVADYAVSDAPELEGLDVPLIATDAASARTMVDAARPMVADIYADTFNAHVLAIAPYPPQVVFCNADVASLADLEGKKIRASGRMTALFLEALGAEGITLGFGEVPGALQRGVVDCAITGAGSGYNAGWWEVSTHLLAIPLAAGIQWSQPSTWTRGTACPQRIRQRWNPPSKSSLKIQPGRWPRMVLPWTLPALPAHRNAPLAMPATWRWLRPARKMWPAPAIFWSPRFFPIGLNVPAMIGHNAGTPALAKQPVCPFH